MNVTDLTSEVQHISEKMGLYFPLHVIKDYVALAAVDYNDADEDALFFVRK